MSLVARGVRFRYAEDGPWVLDAMDIELAPGELVGLIGPNGAGKSTLVRVLSGIERPCEGSVTLGGVLLHSLRRRDVARAVAVVAQAPVLPEGFPVAEVVAMGRAPHVGFLRGERAEDFEAVARVLHQTGLWPLRAQPVERLSGGERQRVALARALAQDPSFVLLDEPTSHLDVRYQLEILERAQREASLGRSVMAVLHDLNLASRCDRVVLMHRGATVASGPPEEVLVESLLSETYRAPLRIAQVDGRIVVVPGAAG